MKKYAIMILIFCTTLAAQAFEDCILSTNGKLSNIEIENREIVDISPNTTITNEKDTLIIRALKEGSSKFSLVKDNREKYVFNVKVNQFETTVDYVDGFEVLSLDEPPTIDLEDEIDPPPILQKEEEIGIPPQLREGE